MTYIKQIQQVGEQLVRNINKEVGYSIVKNSKVIETPNGNTYYAVKFNVDEKFTHVLEWLKNELPTDFSTYYKDNEWIVFLT